MGKETVEYEPSRIIYAYLYEMQRIVREQERYMLCWKRANQALEVKEEDKPIQSLVAKQKWCLQNAK